MATLSYDAHSTGGLARRGSIRFTAAFWALRMASFIALAVAMPGTALSQEPPQPSGLSIYLETTLSGIQSAQLPDKAPDECQQLCLSRSGCAGFDYSYVRKTCTIFAAVGTAKPGQQSIAGTRTPVAGYKAPTNQPSAVPRPAATVPPSAPGKTCIVSAEFTGTPLNLRDRPLGKILGTLADGLSVTIIGRQKFHDRTWVRITGAGNGWVAEDYLNCGH